MYSVYCIYDSAAKKWSPPAVLENDKVALRMFRATLEKNPVDAQDYRVYRVGIFDEYASLTGESNREVFTGICPVVEVDTAGFFKGE